ncbi:hypothetical protein Plhal304r1_c007g0028231 [Plasmopara halstedii]
MMDDPAEKCLVHLRLPLKKSVKTVQSRIMRSIPSVVASVA